MTEKTNMQQILAEAAAVLELESRSILQMSRRLDQNFIEMVEMIYKSPEG